MKLTEKLAVLPTITLLVDGKDIKIPAIKRTIFQEKNQQFKSLMTWDLIEKNFCMSKKPEIK